jgi:hypothetical protein
MSAGGWIKSGIPIGGFRLIKSEISRFAGDKINTTIPTLPVDYSFNNLNGHTYSIGPTLCSEYNGAYLSSYSVISVPDPGLPSRERVRGI